MNDNERDVMVTQDEFYLLLMAAAFRELPVSKAMAFAESRPHWRVEARRVIQRIAKTDDLELRLIAMNALKELDAIDAEFEEALVQK